MAHRAALAEMGSRNAVKHQVWSSRWESTFDGIVQDLRLSLRTLAKSPGFTVVALLSLALGIGGNTDIFTLIHQVLLQNLPVRDPQQLVTLGKSEGDGIMGGVDLGMFPWNFARQLESNPGPFQGIASYGSFAAKVSVRAPSSSDAQDPNKPAILVPASLVSGNYFSLLGAQPILGRTIAAALRDERYESASGSEGECETQCSTSQREQERLDQTLAHDTQTAGAERETGGVFALTCCRACEQEVGQVCAGDEQYEAHDGHEKLERVTVFTARHGDAMLRREQGHRDAIDLLLARGGNRVTLHGANAIADLLVEPLLTLREGSFVRYCLRAKSREEMQEVWRELRSEERSMLQDDGLHGDGRPQANRFHFELNAVEIFRHDADDREGCAVDSDGLAQDVRVCRD
jgi:hypothetical protein